MDKIQLNNEVILMRKTIKRVKVQAVNHLTRQARVLRSKKGKPEQLEKNRKRCERLIGEVQAIKDWQPDDITYAALGRACAVVNEKKLENARERALHRLIHHKLFVKQFATFKDLVTPDLLQIKVPNREEPVVGPLSDGEEEELLAKKRSMEKRGITGKNKPPPSPPESDGSDSGRSEEDSDEESFFLPSKRSKTESNRSNPSGQNPRGRPAKSVLIGSDGVPDGEGNSSDASEEEERIMPDGRNRGRPTANLSAETGGGDETSDSGDGSGTDDDSDSGDTDGEETSPLVDQPSGVQKGTKRKQASGVSAPKTSRRRRQLRDDEQNVIFGSASEEERIDIFKRVKEEKINLLKKRARKQDPDMRALKTSRKIQRTRDDEGDLSFGSASEEEIDIDLEEGKFKGGTIPLEAKRKKTKEYVPSGNVPPKSGRQGDGGSSGESDSLETNSAVGARKGGPLVDLPFLIKKETKEKKHIPGISAPLMTTAGTTTDKEVTSTKRLEGRSIKRSRETPLRKNAKPRLDQSKKRTKRQAPIEKKSEEDENLHPSWLARKAQKERETMAVSFAGKKTTFDDD